MIVAINSLDASLVGTISPGCCTELLVELLLLEKDVLRAHGSNKKNFRFRLWATYKPIPVRKDNSMLTYIPVSFLFSFIFRVQDFRLGLG